MKKVVVFILALIAFVGSILVTYYITSATVNKKNSDMYQVAQWPYQRFLRIEDVKVECTKDSLGMFDDGCPIKVHINGNLAVGGPISLYVDNVHISERIDYNEDNEKIAVIEITPIVSARTEGEWTNEEKIYPVDYVFDYTLRTFEPSSYNKFVIKCADIEKELVVYQGK